MLDFENHLACQDLRIPQGVFNGIHRRTWNRSPKFFEPVRGVSAGELPLQLRNEGITIFAPFGNFLEPRTRVKFGPAHPFTNAPVYLFLAS